MSDDAADVARVRAGWDEARFGLGLGPDESAFAELVARYREPHRRYHDLAHVAACLRALEGGRALAERPAEVMAALLFHDAVYVPLARDNEARSAALATDVLGRAGLGSDALARVGASILATATHDAPAGGDAALVVDVDMSILAAPPEAFDAYEDAVRAEHAAVDAAAFAAGRAAFVARLLARPRLFFLPELAARWEAPARANLMRSLARWAAPSGRS